jgi:polyhydroxybutyrate depolymerase
VAADVMELRYTACEDNKDFVLYTIVDGGHTWPGVPRMPERSVGKTTVSVHASEAMWDFFSRYRLAND